MKLIVNKTLKDPHHGGASEWCVFDGRFYIKMEGRTEWTEVKKMHSTPARILMLAELLKAVEPKGVEYKEIKGRCKRGRRR